MPEMNADTFSIAAAVAGGGGIVGWVRERRKSRKDANGFALEFIKAQSLRIDELVREVAELRADNRVYDTTIVGLTRENADLRTERDKERQEKALLNAEIDRLKTALQRPHDGGHHEVRNPSS